MPRVTLYGIFHRTVAQYEPMETDFSWDRLKLVLAIVRTGSLSGAARELGVNHATAYRRLTALERDLDAALFERNNEGYVATETGLRFAQAAATAESEIQAAHREISGDTPTTPAGPLRITTTDSLFCGLIARLLPEFRQRYPRVMLTVDVSNSVHDLARRTADIAIRPDNAPSEHLVGRQLGVIRQAVYVALDRPAETDLWVGPSEQMGYPTLSAWLVNEGHERDVICRVNSGLSAQAAAAAGLGRAVLPCYLGDADPRLSRQGAPIEALTTALWLLVHPSVRGTPSVRAFSTFVAEALGDALSFPVHRMP